MTENKNTVSVWEIDDIMNNSKLEAIHDGKTTIVKAILPNGFIIVESSSCVDPANYDPVIGEEICLKRIRDKVWELEGYVLQSEVFGMSFTVAYEQMKQGKDIKLPEWQGFWRWNAETETIDMHLKTGEIMDIRETKDVDFTVSNMLRKDWVVVDDQS